MQSIVDGYGCFSFLPGEPFLSEKIQTEQVNV